MKIQITSFALLLSTLIYSQTLNTQLRDNAGAPTNQSGFYQTSNPVNYPPGATSWWHLLDVRHANASENNYGMQFAGSFFNQELWFRKTNTGSWTDALTPWSKFLLQNPEGRVVIGGSNPRSILDITSSNNQSLLINYQDKSSLTFVPNNGNSWFSISHGLNNDLAISQGSNVDTERLMTIKNNGYVGIGISEPTAKLDINGNMRINSNSQYTFLTLGQQSNDQIIVDNTAQKHYGGGYFFRVHNDAATNQFIDALIIDENGNIGIGTNPPQHKLDVAGKSSFSDNMKVNAKIEAKEIKVTQSPTADFVFEEEYSLPKLEDVEKHIKEKKHLPEIASAKEMEKDGVNVGEFQIKLLQKIEELTLYTIEQNKQLKIQAEKIEKLENTLTAQKTK